MHDGCQVDLVTCSFHAECAIYTAIGGKARRRVDRHLAVVQAISCTLVGRKTSCFLVMIKVLLY